MAPLALRAWTFLKIFMASSSSRIPERGRAGGRAGSLGCDGWDGEKEKEEGREEEIPNRIGRNILVP